MKCLLQRGVIAGAIWLVFGHDSIAEVGNDNPTGVTGEYNGNITTAGSYDPYTGNAKRFIDDLTVTGAAGTYPLKWTRVLNTRGAASPFGHGGTWSHSYRWGLSLRDPSQDNKYHENPYEGPTGLLIYPDGRQVALQTQSPPSRTSTRLSPPPRNRWTAWFTSQAATVNTTLFCGTAAGSNFVMPMAP